MKNRMNTRTCRLIAAVLVLVTVGLLFAGCSGGKYKTAAEAYDAGNYAEAAEAFAALGDYKDSADRAKDASYRNAAALKEAGNYAEACEVYLGLGDYEDSAALALEAGAPAVDALAKEGKFDEAVALCERIGDETLLASANMKKSLNDHADVFAALKGHTWYCNGGTVNSMDGYTFTEKGVTAGHIFYDGNGEHKDEDAAVPFLIDDASITISGKEPLTIPYKLSGNTLTLGSKDFYNEKDVDKAIQGYWKCRSLTYNVITGFTWSEHNIYFHNGRVTSEHAVPDAFGRYEYLYYGPYEGTYTLGFGVIKSSDKDAAENWYFLIKDKKVCLMHFDKDATKSNGLPGQDGYSF